MRTGYHNELMCPNPTRIMIFPDLIKKPEQPQRYLPAYSYLNIICCNIMIGKVFHLACFFVFASYLDGEFVIGHKVSFVRMLYQVSPPQLIVEKSFPQVAHVWPVRRQGVRQVRIVQVKFFGFLKSSNAFAFPVKRSRKFSPLQVMEIPKQGVPVQAGTFCQLSNIGREGSGFGNDL